MLYCVYKYVDASVVLRRGHRRLRGHFGRGPDMGTEVADNNLPGPLMAIHRTQ